MALDTIYSENLENRNYVEEHTKTLQTDRIVVIKTMY